MFKDLTYIVQTAQQHFDQKLSKAGN